MDLVIRFKELKEEGRRIKEEMKALIEEFDAKTTSGATKEELLFLVVKTHDLNIRSAIYEKRSVAIEQEYDRRSSLRKGTMRGWKI